MNDFLKGCFSIASGAWSKWLSDLNSGSKPELDDFVLRNIVFNIVENLAPSSGDTVVDFGAGDGLVTFELAKAVGSTGRVIAVDKSAECLQLIEGRCRKRGIENIEIVQSSIEECPLPPSSADGIVCKSVLCYLEDMQLGVHKMLEILRDGGVFSIFEPLLGESSLRGGKGAPPAEFLAMEDRLKESGPPRSINREKVRGVFAGEAQDFESIIVHYRFSFEKMSLEEIVKVYFFDLPGELSAYSRLVECGYDIKELEKIISEFATWATDCRAVYVIPCIFIYGTKSG